VAAQCKSCSASRLGTVSLSWNFSVRKPYPPFKLSPTRRMRGHCLGPLKRKESNAFLGCLCFLVLRIPGDRSRGPGFDSRCYQTFWHLVSLEWGPLRIVSAVEELLERSSCSSLENREYGRRDPSRWPRGTLYLQRLALTSPTSGGRSIGIVRLRTQTTVFFGPLKCNVFWYPAPPFTFSYLSVSLSLSLLLCWCK
jgi:hypothetical protein